MLFFLVLKLYCLLTWPDTPSTVEVLPRNSFLDSFSSKTAYRNSRLMPSEDLSMESDKCRLVHVNAVFRHGSRYPSKDDMIKIEQVHKKIKESRNQFNISDDFLKWKSSFPIDKPKQLSSIGFEEMMQLGQRFRDRLNTVDGYFNEKTDIAVFSTSVSRSKQSGATFLRKFLKEKKTFKEVSDIIKERDTQLRFFDNCQYYTTSVLKNKTSKIEHKKFSKGPEIKRIVKEVQKKWNLTDVDLTTDDVRNLYLMCGYEIANNISSSMMPNKCHINAQKEDLNCPTKSKSQYAETSPLCSLLDPKHYAVFEYLSDLKHYWTKSYGKDINWQQSCELMSPIVDQINDAAKGHQDALKASKSSGISMDSPLNHQNYLRASFWFGHAETVLPITALLGLFNQKSPMTAKSYKQRLELINNPKERFNTFRVSNITPFAGNIALELHHCPHLAKGDDNGYMVSVRSNEKTMDWSLANGKSQMPLATFLKYLNLCSSSNYNREKVCIQGKNLRY